MTDDLNVLIVTLELLRDADAQRSQTIIRHWDERVSPEERSRSRGSADAFDFCIIKLREIIARSQKGGDDDGGVEVR